MIAQPQQMELDAISKSIQKNVKNNAIVQRTETGNVLLPDGFPADAGEGKDQYGNVINNMAVTKSYVDSHAGGSIAWYTLENAPTGKTVLFQIIRTQIEVTLSDENTTTLVLVMMAPGKVNQENLLRIFVSAWIRDNNYKYYATSGLYTNYLGSGYKVFVNIYSVETGEKVGTYTELITTLYSNSKYQYVLM